MGLKYTTGRTFVVDEETNRVVGIADPSAQGDSIQYLGVADQADPIARINERLIRIPSSIGRRLVVWGDSTAAMNAVTDVSATVRAYLGNAWVPLGLSFSRHPLDVVAVSGRSGLRADQIISEFSADVLAYSPDVVIISAGTNDLIQGRTADATFSVVSQMAVLCSSIGAAPILTTISCGESFSGASSAIRDEWIRYNNLVRNYAFENGVRLIDLETAYIDPASATSAPISGYTDGAVHPANKGAFRWAQRLAAVLSDIPARSLGSVARGAWNAASNPLFGGSGGTANGATGTIPSTCVVTKSAGATVDSSVIARTGGRPGNWWQCVVSLPANTDYASMVLGSATNIAGSKFSVGDIVRCVADVEVDSPVNILGVDLRLRFNGSSGIEWVQSFSPASASGDMLPESYSGKFRTPEMQIPAGTTSVQAYISILNGSGAYPQSVTVRVGACAIERV